MCFAAHTAVAMRSAPIRRVYFEFDGAAQAASLYSHRSVLEVEVGEPQDTATLPRKAPKVYARGVRDKPGPIFRVDSRSTSTKVVPRVHNL